IIEGLGVLQPALAPPPNNDFLSDYSQLTIDPTDDCTFWYTNAYQLGNSPNPNWGTQIASFRSDSCAKVAASLIYTGVTTQDFRDVATLSARLTNASNGLGIAGA